MPFYVYAIINPAEEIYIGQTSDLERRLREHNDPDCRITLHTKRRPGPWKVFFSETHKVRSEVMKREKELKTCKGREFLRSLLENSDEPVTGPT
ncbi:MAG: GIY-YIG nuclease family protein [Synergistota bacterium]|nr:GIY-YIG nuclease family protein [Synergistota bacterium]